MKRIAETKSTTRRETDSYYRGRPLMIELQPLGVELRPKGKVKRVFVPWDAIFDLGSKIEGRKLAEERRQAKLARKSKKLW